ncbi:E3 ubiquitin-protein ligase TRIM71-like isoform X2 [Mytilus californianus]|uniref:E3 ubiquitin-protein ligase TRIM71-like isoform X2 n=1 Tax=Mytilus californianus TaxID=6549 RepID=UPI002246CBE9|nr:E3 ubiquitin-protein ligase TRIM71-like isoform X2 [Mytilus californianus]
MAQTAFKSCEICDGGLGHQYCQQCDQLFCKNCKTSHLRTKISKNHTFFIGRNINQEEQQFCAEHDESFIFYCVDCDTVVCKICAVKRHNRHDMSEINESVLKLKVQLKKYAESKVKGLRKDIEKLDGETIEYQSEVQSVIQSIIEDSERMNALIDRKTDELIKSVKEVEERNLKILSTANSKFSNNLHKVNRVQRTIKDSAYMSDVALLPKLQQLQAEIYKIEPTRTPGIPTVRYSTKKISHSDTGKLFGDLSFSNVICLNNAASEREDTGCTRSFRKVVQIDK